MVLFGLLHFDADTKDWLFTGVKADQLNKQIALDPSRDNKLNGVRSNFAEYIARLARSIAVALDAEVAVREIVRAEYKLNRERERRGKPPIFDYHVVRLAHRLGRPAPVPPEFRRRNSRLIERLRERGCISGAWHWRHYSSHRTWIRWQLVGDPGISGSSTRSIGYDGQDAAACAGPEIGGNLAAGNEAGRRRIAEIRVGRPLT
jgi:hypothetical protein